MAKQEVKGPEPRGKGCRWGTACQGCQGGAARMVFPPGESHLLNVSELLHSLTCSFEPCPVQKHLPDLQGQKQSEF